MRKLLLATSAILATTVAAGVTAVSIAQAADLQPRMAVKAPPPVRPACAQFGGFYVGGNIGWAYHDQTWVDRDNWVDNFDFDFHLGSVSTTRNGVTGGLQAGFNWQRGCTLFGVEVDGNWANLKGSKSYSPTDIGSDGFTILTLEDKVKWWGSLRGRTGLIVEDLLLYVTGGVAYANIQHTATITDGFVPTETFSSTSGRWGWVGGVGAEWAVSSTVSIKSEVLYIRFTEVTTTGFSPAGPSTVNFDYQDSMWVSRVGINFKLGGPY
jgi:outer membrane immunogenic protein